MMTRRVWSDALLVVATGLLGVTPVSASQLPVSGGSFEAPVIIDPPFETPFIPVLSLFGWSETGPITTDPGSGFEGTLDTGVFYNFEFIEFPDGNGGTTIIPNPEFVTGVDGDQAAFIGAIPEPVGGEDAVSAYQFLGPANTYQAGLSYSLLVDVGKSGRPGFTPPDTSELGLQFIYQNDLDQIVVLDTLTLTAVDIQANDLNEEGLVLDLLGPGDHIGREIGIRILPLSGVSGNWTFDNVRVDASLIGDLDGDGFVGIDDLNIVLSNWNQNVPPGDPAADPSGDGFVGIDDLNTVLGNWNAGTPPPPAAVPEPVSSAFLGVGLAGMLMRRRP